MKISNEYNENYNFTLEDIITPPDSIVDNATTKAIFDNWKNQVANINCNNAIMRFTQYQMNKIQYYELAQLSTDTIINKAINTLSKDIIGNKGSFSIIEKIDNSRDVISLLETELESLDFWLILKKAIETTLIYGGCLLYLDNNYRSNMKIPHRMESYQDIHNLKRLQIIEPIYIAPNQVETANPLKIDYMKPKKWFVNQSILDSSQVIPIVIFDIPSMYKPLYNYLGISYIQFMQPFVRNCESIRESLADMFLRFRTTVIKTRDKFDERKIAERIKYHNRAANNHSVLMLTEDEDFIQTITSITGMEGILNQAYQSLAIAARMPAVKLLGLSPQGLNNTGEFDMKNYYDEIESYQKSIFKDIVVKIVQNVLWGLGYKLTIDFEFTPISQESYLEKIQRYNIYVDLISKLISEGLLTDEQGFDMIKKESIIEESMSMEADDDIDIDIENEDKDEENEENKNEDIKNDDENNKEESNLQGL